MEGIEKKIVKTKEVMKVEIAEDGNVLVYCMLTEPDELMGLVGNICRALANFIQSKKSLIEKVKIVIPKA